MNKAILIGRLTKDPELRYTQNEKAVSNFTVAVNRQFTKENGEREADFINIVVWNKQAENTKQYLSKGSQVAIEGSMQTRSYKDDNDKTIYVTEVIASSVQFLDNKKSDQQENEVSPHDFQAPEEDAYEDMGNQIELDINDDDSPF